MLKKFSQIKYFIIIILVFNLIMIIISLYILHNQNVTNDPTIKKFIDRNDLITKNNIKPESFHIMYSVGCGDMMKWQLIQTIILEHSWMRVKQTGNITRIVSGCNDRESIEWMTKSVLPFKADIHYINDTNLINTCLRNYNNSNKKMRQVLDIKLDFSTPLHIIFVPSFDDIKKKYHNVFGYDISYYPQLNRIIALYMVFHCNKYFEIDFNIDEYTVVIDPDFYFLKQLNVEDMKINYGLNKLKPIGGVYGLGGQYIPWYKDYYTQNNKLNDPVYMKMYPYLLKHKQDYAVGVPYILNNLDWYHLIIKWIKYIPFGWKKYSGIESDMYAFIMAALDTELKFNSINPLTTFQSNCMMSDNHFRAPFNPNKQYFIHYCSSYHLKLNIKDENNILYGMHNYTFNKHWMKARYKQSWIFYCESSLLIEPPILSEFENVFKQYGYKKTSKINDKRILSEYKHYIVLHYLIPKINDAILAFKHKYCKNNWINTNKSIYLHEATLQNGDVLFNDLLFDKI